MADLVDLLPQIPVIMKKKGWKTASALMQRWFDGSPSDDRDKQPADTTDVTMDWVLSFPRAKTVYDKLVSDRIWMNKPAQAEIAHMLHGNMATITAPVPFGDLRNAVPAIDKHYINERSVVSSPLGDPLDDLFGALGSFNFRVAVQGVVAPLKVDANPASKPSVAAPVKPVVFEVTLKQAGIYVHDSYDFQDDHWYSQPLGFWGFDGEGSVSKFPGLSSYAVYNSSFRDYRARKRHGGDFWVYSDVKVINLMPPATFEITL